MNLIIESGWKYNEFQNFRKLYELLKKHIGITSVKNAIVIIKMIVHSSNVLFHKCTSSEQNEIGKNYWYQIHTNFLIDFIWFHYKFFPTNLKRHYVLNGILSTITLSLSTVERYSFKKVVMILAGDQMIDWRTSILMLCLHAYRPKTNMLKISKSTLRDPLCLPCTSSS